MLLKIPSESGLVGKVQLIRHFFDTEFGAAQIVLRTNQCDGLNPLDGGTTGLSLDDRRQIIGREVLLVGIEHHRTLLVTMPMHRHQKGIEYPFLPSLLQFFDRETIKIKLHHLKQESLYQALHLQLQQPDRRAEVTCSIRS